MKLIKAEHLGMCFGVRDAIALAMEHVKSRPVTVLGELAHNPTVLKTLRGAGVRFANHLSEVGTTDVMVTAHGASEKTLANLRAQGFLVTEATCPLVHFAHRSLRDLAAAGYHPVVIGCRDHVEVRGMTGDFPEHDVVLSGEDVRRLAWRPKYGVVAQTTQPVELARRLVQLIRERFPESEVRFVDTVCQPTKQRQNAAVELARQCDLVLVIGGANSNNTRQLAETCARHCERVVHIQGSHDLREEWFSGVNAVGVTAGTSTPDSVIAGVEAWIRERHPERAEETAVPQETFQ